MMGDSMDALRTEVRRLSVEVANVKNRAARHRRRDALTIDREPNLALEDAAFTFVVPRQGA